jgi:hypothetical protein
LKPLRYTAHALDAIAEREIDTDWIEAAVRQPDWQTADPGGGGVERRYRQIPAAGNRILRVVCLETTTGIAILTVFFDRKARRTP